MTCNRRDFLKLSASALAAAMLPMPAMAATLNRSETKRTLAFYNTHTLESLHVCYFDHNGYRPDALAQINHILRDYRTGEILPIDPHLLDQLFVIKQKIHPHKAFHVISGYRSPATNAMLRQVTTGVARQSLHTKGQAIDIRLPDCNTHRLRDLCVKLKAGGVGYYPKSDFVHIDTGEFRTW